jgi:LytR cell envelope-related transcriptional attenuator
VPPLDTAQVALGAVKIVDRVGPILGIVAFCGLAVLVLLLFFDAREVRRLREWAGRAPERAAEAIEAQRATAEARDELEAGPPPGWRERQRDRLHAAREAVGRRLGPAWRELDRRSPVDARIVVALALVAGVAVAAALTSGFGLVSSNATGRDGGATAPPGKIRVAVLNGTQESGVAPVAGLASTVTHDVVKPAGYKAGPVTNAPGSFSSTVIMFTRHHLPDARALATAVKPKLGQPQVQPITGSVRSVAKKAELALVVGLDDSRFGK